MFFEYASGAVAQLARFVGGLPRAFGWSAATTETPPVTAAGVVTASATARVPGASASARAPGATATARAPRATATGRG